MSVMDAKAKKGYEKPMVTPVDLATKEVLGGCKTDATTTGAGGGLQFNCVTLNCSSDNKPS